MSELTSRDLQRMRRSALKLSATKDRLLTSRADTQEYVDRPLRRKISFNFQQQSPLELFASKLGWSTPPMRRLWSYGLSSCELIDIISAFPESIHMVLEPAVDAVRISGCPLKDSPTSLQMTVQDWQNNSNFTSEFGCKGAGEILANCDSFDLNHSPLCLLRMMFNPETQLRTNVRANAGMASLLDMHREEMLARIAGHELPLFFTQLDIVRLFLFMMLEDILLPGTLRVKHLRLAVGPKACRRGILVRWHSLSHLDGQGRVTEVSAPRLVCRCIVIKVIALINRCFKVVNKISSIVAIKLVSIVSY